MLTLYKARTVTEGADKVLSEIVNHKGRNVVIVPDPFTLAVEQAVTKKLGAQGVFDVEVMSFSRLAAVTLKKKIKKCLSPAGSVLLMEKVIRACEKDLKHYGRAARKAGFAAEVYAAITSLRNSGVTAERLAEAAEILRGYSDKVSAFVANKTYDIALLYGEYLKELTVNHTDSTTRLEALVAEIESSEEFGDVHFHVIDHVDLNRKQIEVVAALVRHAKSVTVAVATGEGAENKSVYPHLYGKLVKEIAPFSPIEEKTVPFTLSGDRAYLAESLFSYSFSPIRSDAMTLAEAKDMTEEVTYLATEITRLIRDKGLRYCDVAVITPSFSEYLPYVERIFRRYDIPFFPDARYPLSECSFFRYAVMPLEILDRNCEQSVVRGFISHPLFTAVTEEEKAAFCDYLDKTGLNYKKLREPFALYQNDPLFPLAEKVRFALWEELAAFSDLPTSAPIRTYTGALRAFLENNDYESRLEKYVVAIEARDLKKQAEVLRRTYSALIDLTEVMEELRGEETVTLSEFLTALDAGAGQIKLAALPVRLDCVYFAAVEQAMYAPIPALFVIGAEEGLFPLEKVKEGILGQTEYAVWQNQGIEIKVENVGVEELAASKFHALQLLLRPDRLTITHLSGRTASSCMGQLQRLFSIDKIQKCAELLKAYPIETAFPTREVAEGALVEYSRREREGLLTDRDRDRAAAIAEALGSRFPLSFEEDPIDSIPEEVARRVFFRDGTFSVSEMENYFDCPFKHFIQYGLHAKERPFADQDNRDIGNLAHDTMCDFVKKYLPEIKKGEISEDDAKRITMELARDKIRSNPRYQAILEKEGSRVLEKTVTSIGEVGATVKEQIFQSDFVPQYFEIPFGDESKRSPLSTVRIDGVRLFGKMDRVDVLPPDREGKKHAIAIDYKTGDNKIGEEKVYSGIKVQLPLYSAVLAASGLEPTAALYASLKANNKDSYLYGPKRGGQAMMEALDHTVGSKKSDYLGISMNKEGALKAPLWLSDGEFDAITEYVTLLTQNAIREIKSGCVVPSSVKMAEDGACAKCDLKDVCRHAEKWVRRLPSKVKAEDFLQIVEKEKKGGN